MTTPHDVVPAPESLNLPPHPHDDEIIASSLFQEINERRARVENTELLQHLRGL
ncbi:hypothetical protein [Phenylobacterium sp.]|uniref:hypothetical protein n=1 Tax=Phenylobacterium sp. TaxID=1871053 RepID=UPI0025CD12F3|nr:hypothetical protein [Phenylobacterium sp.]